MNELHTLATATPWQRVETGVEFLNGLFFGPVTIGILLAAGLAFTIWTKFGQFRALTHGIAVVRGKYDDKDDPGAVNHFQALSTALSATVGLGNIGGVAAAVALGGPGAVFWMWVIGVLGMALKMTEVTQTMLHRNIDNPHEPHGGPMFVVRNELSARGLPKLGFALGVVFCFTVLASAVTGGNMFQAWNVAEVTTSYVPGLPRTAIGVVLALVVGVVIVGGVKRIGAVTGKLVPFMCLLYLGCAVAVIAVNIADVPAAVLTIVRAGLGLDQTGPVGAFLGGTFGYAALFGIKRALFSSEAGQGSAPIAHAAAKCDEPVREGVVAGLEPFIDTIVVCTMTALVIMLSGAWDRAPEGRWDAPPAVVPAVTTAFSADGTAETEVITGRLVSATAEQIVIDRVAGGLGQRLAERTTISRDRIDQALVATIAAERVAEAERTLAERRDAAEADNPSAADTEALARAAALLRRARAANDADPALITEPDAYVLGIGRTPPRDAAARAIRAAWPANATVFVNVRADENPDTNADIHRLYGVIGEFFIERPDGDDAAAEPERRTFIAWTPFASDTEPTLVQDPAGPGLYGDYVAAALTAHAFDRAFPGLGQYLIVLASWLFAISTIISWSYYGEQAVVFTFGPTAKGAVLAYKVAYCVLALVSTFPFIKTERELDLWTTLGLGAMLVANIPIMLVFGHRAMAAYHDYGRKLKAGAFLPHDAPAVTEVVEGKDPETPERSDA